MALNWRWEDKCGEATIVDIENREHTLNLYEGNAFLIFLREYEEDGHNMYSLWSFWADKEHMKNCLGLNKKKGYTSNIYEYGSSKIVKMRFNKDKCRYLKDITTALVQAFDNINIEIYKENKDD